MTGGPGAAAQAGGGLLIVNADDLGYDERTTDHIIECFAAGRITSATAMVHMRDSERAALLARQCGLPVGLHVNLTEPFTGAQAPMPVADQQLRVARRLGLHGKRRLRRWLFDPFIQEDVERAIADQLAVFEALYGQPPTHVDGHQHVHVYPNVAAARTLAPGTKMRGVLWGYPDTKSAGAVARSVRRRLVSRRFESTEHFFDIGDVDPRTSSRLGLAASATVEVMCHPGFAEERACLLADEWATALARHRLGSYADLGRAGAVRAAVRALDSSTSS